MSWPRQALLACILMLAAGGPAQANERLTTIDAAGLSAELSAAREQVILVNFWATWCRPCLEEIPLLMELEAEFAPRGFRLIAVSLDDIETMETSVIPFMQKWFPDFVSFQSVEYEMDDMVSTIDRGWNEVLPTSYLLARDGSVAERLQGKFTRAEFAEFIGPLLD